MIPARWGARPVTRPAPRGAGRVTAMIQPLRSTSGLNEPDVPLAPTAQTIAAPGLVATELSASEPALGLATVVHAVPFQFSVSVCRVMVPGTVSEPTAHTSFAAFDVLTPAWRKPARSRRSSHGCAPASEQPPPATARHPT